jgi:hypothetical protein
MLGHPIDAIGEAQDRVPAFAQVLAPCDVAGHTLDYVADTYLNVVISD